MNLILLQAHEVMGGDRDKQEHAATAATAAALLNLDDPRVQHILGHLGKQPGDTITVGVMGGQQGKARIDKIISRTNKHDDFTHKSAQQLRLVLQFDPFRSSTSQQHHTNKNHNNNNNNNEPTITLILAVPFPKRLKALWSMVASMDYVTRIVLVRAALSDPDHCQTSALTPSIYQPLIEEGLTQGKRTCHIQVDIQIDQVVCRETLERLGLTMMLSHDDNSTESNSSCVKLFLDCGDEKTVPPAALDVVLQSFRGEKGVCNHHKSGNNAPSAVVAVGPERGWTDAEAKLFTSQGAAAGFQACTIGRSILRVDTAVVAGLAIVGAALNQVVAAGATDSSNNDTAVTS